MIEIPLGAHVECDDGRCGKVTQVVVDRDTLRVSHLVIRDPRNPIKHSERLVPLERVAGIGPGTMAVSHFVMRRGRVRLRPLWNRRSRT